VFGILAIHRQIDIYHKPFYEPAIVVTLGPCRTNSTGPTVLGAQDITFTFPVLTNHVSGASETNGLAPVAIGAGLVLMQAVVAGLSMDIVEVGHAMIKSSEKLTGLFSVTSIENE
jgi:hypothetical protein